MIVGIVGSEAAKFTRVTEARARVVIRHLIRNADVVISGHSPLGGIDWWAIEEAERMGRQTREYPPLEQNWANGFRPRNLQIAEASDAVACITVLALPSGYNGMRFAGCYHCGTLAGHHVKSGGCWTMLQAHAMGKRGKLVVIGENGFTAYAPEELPAARRVRGLTVPMEIR